MELAADEEIQLSLIEKEEPTTIFISNPGQTESAPCSNLNRNDTMTSRTRTEEMN
jgi:hypothetical protein